jgi:7-cyano-7-deazaguanine synthase
MARALALGLDWEIDVAAPYRALHKEQVIVRGVELGVPFELTLSCMSPAEAGEAAVPVRHCGACSKCRERRDAFAAAGVPDPTPYVSASRA